MSNIKEIELNNGIKILLKHNSYSPLVSILCLSPGGIRMEDESTGGIHLLLSSLLQKGTTSRSHYDLNHSLTLAGAHVDSFVGKNTFGFRMDCLSKNLEEAFHIYFDMLQNSLFKDEFLEMEKKRLSEEIRTIKDNYEAYLYDTFLKAIYPDHPYRQSPLGTESSLRKISVEVVGERMRQILDPGNMIFAIVGNFDEEKTVLLLEQSLSDLTREKENNFKKYRLNSLRNKIKIKKNIKSKNAYINVGYRTTTINAENRFAVEVINAALSSLGGGLLFERLRENLGLVYSVDSIIFHGIEQGYLVIYLNCAPENVKQAIGEIKNVINDLKKNELSSRDMERIKAYLIGSYEIALQRNSAQALNIALNKLYGIGINLNDYSKGIQCVTSQRVIQTANEYFNDDKSCEVVLSPV